MPEEILNNAAPAASTPETPAEVVASAAKEVAESKPVAEEGTLLGKKVDEGAATVAPVKAEVPEKYEVKAPEGMTIDSAVLDAVSPVFKELGLSNEGAQKLVDAYAPQVTAMLERQQQEAMTAYANIKKEWKAETIKELGVNSDKELAYAAKFINAFGSDDLRKVLDDTGLGNNIHFVRALIKAGKAFGTDTFPEGSKGAGQPLSDSEKAKSLFPTMKE